MKYVLFFILAIVGGIAGGYAREAEITEIFRFGATVARTTITNQWTFNATTTTANITATTANTATSTLQVGCIQHYATSTATPHHVAIASTLQNTTTFDGVNSNFFLVSRYGKCPKI